MLFLLLLSRWRVTVFCILILSTQCLLKKKSPYFCMSVWSIWLHYIIPLLVSIGVIIQQNIEKFSKKHSTQNAHVLVRGFVINWLAKGIVPSDTIFYRCRFEGAIKFLSESQAAHERGRNWHYTLLLERMYSVGCKHWSMGSRHLKGNHTSFSVPVLCTWNEHG